MRNFTATFTSYHNGVRLISAPWFFRATDFDDAVRCANLFLEGMRSGAAKNAIIELMAIAADGYHGDKIKDGGATIWDDPAPVGGQS